MAAAALSARRLMRDSVSLSAAARPGGKSWVQRNPNKLVVCCESRAAATTTMNKGEGATPAVSDGSTTAAVAGFTVVMKFGGSSVASAERMREVADLIISFPEETPVVVLAAMGKTTNNLLLAGEKAVSCGAWKVSELDELKAIKDLHLRTIDELGLDRSIVSGFLDELEQLLKGVAMIKELTPRTRDYLVSFGECMSTRIFAAYLNKLGKKARQYDAFDLGIITTDDFMNAHILEATYPAVARRLQLDWIDDPAIPIVTGFLGKGWKSGAITTLGRGGSDLTATTIGKALGLRESQVWKDVDGVLKCDPNITIVGTVTTSMLEQYGFPPKVVLKWEDLGISVDSVATGEVTISVKLDPAKLLWFIAKWGWNRFLGSRRQ